MKSFSYKLKNVIGSRTFSKKPKKKSKKKKLSLKEMQNIALRVLEPKKTPEYIRAHGAPQEKLEIDAKDYDASKNPRSGYGHIIETPLKTVDAAAKLQPGLSQLAESRNDFKPVEKLTGISQDRPEIILLSDYLPLYDENGELSEAGKLFEAHVDERKIKERDALQILNSQVTDSNKTFFDLTIRDLSTFLRNVVTNTQATREMLDLRDARLRVAVAENTAKEADNLIGSAATSAEKDFQESNLKQNYNLEDFLISVGYANAAKFSSTKLWIQSVLDYKTLLKGHGLTLQNNVSVQQHEDSNPVALNYVERKTISFNSSLKQVPTLKFLDTYSFDRIVDDSIIKTVRNTFDNLYTENMPTDLSMRLATIIWLLSQEFRYSKGLSGWRLYSNLITNFDYTVNIPLETNSLSNVGLFDAVFGTSTTSAHKIPELTTTSKSLTQLAYTKSSQNVGVLNFETSYLQTPDEGVLTPGAEYFIDSVLETIGTSADVKSIISFDALKEFSNKLQNSSQALSELARVMNFKAEARADTYLDYKDNAAPTDYTRLEAIYSSPIVQLDQFKKEFLNDTNDRLKSDYVKTWLTAIIKLASTPKNSRLKSLLFLYVMSKTTRGDRGDEDRSSDVYVPLTNNAVVQDRLLFELLKEINTLTSKKSYARTYGSAQEVRQITQEEGRNNLSSLESNKLLQKLVNMMGTYLSATSKDNEVTINERTFYRGLVNTFLAMAYFDALLIFISSYAEINFGPRATDGDFVIIKSQNSYRDLLKNTKSLLTSEISTLSVAYAAVVGTLRTVTAALKKYVEFFENENTTNYLKILKDAYVKSGVSTSAMRLMFYEQQSMLISSNLTDIHGIMKSNVKNDYIKIYDYNVRAADFKHYCLKAFSFNELKLNKSNAKILSVGIPIGFSENLKQYRQLTTNKWRKPAAITGRVLKQNDIITVKVYKMDVRYPDIIFKPKSYKFELSRFPVKNKNYYLADLRYIKTFDELINFMPTRDILQGNINNVDSIYYGDTNSTKIASNPLGGSNVTIGTAFETADYDFLTAKDKRELIKNHAVSFLLELYVKFLTDLDVAESALYLDSSHAETLVDEALASDAIQLAIAYTTNAKPNTDPNDKNKVNNLQKNSKFDIFNGALRGKMTYALNTVTSVLKLHTNLSNENDVIKMLFAPRQFDRVYNLLVDPDEFVVDYTATTRTTFGKEVLDELTREKQIELSMEGSYVLRGVNKNAGDFSLDKYFVVIETMTDEYEDSTKWPLPEVSTTSRRPRGTVI